MDIDVIHNEDCLTGMSRLPDKSIDMILTDLPYGNRTKCEWDVMIPIEPLWSEYRRVIKDGGAIVLTATQPFSSLLVTSNLSMFKHEWIWQKEQGVGFQVAKYRPMQEHEHVLVFGRGRLTYYPQMEVMDKPRKHTRKGNNGDSQSSPLKYSDCRVSLYHERYPTSIKKFTRDRGLHPTQKPVALFEYLIRSYTEEGAIVLDSCIGSGTTAVACIRSGRHFIGYETDSEYHELAMSRVSQTLSEMGEEALGDE